MSVRPIDKATFYSKKPSDKKSLFIENIREIFDNRIEYCEIEDYPYSKNTLTNDVLRYARMFFASRYFDLTGKRIKSYDEIPFVMTKVTDERGDNHIYCAFNVNAWDKMIERAKEDENV